MADGSGPRASPAEGAPSTSPCRPPTASESRRASACAASSPLSHLRSLSGTPFSARSTEADEGAALLVPQLEAKRAHAIPQGEPSDLLQREVLVEALRQVVVGNLAREMVDVVVPDVAGEPMEHRG